MSMATALRSPRTLRASDWRGRAHEGDGWPLRELLAQDFRVERRTTPRWPVAGSATLLGLGAGLGAVVELDGLVGAPWWLSGTAREKLAVGTKVSIGFSDPDARPASGTVVRAVRQDGDAWRIAVRFDEASSAA
ncbi:MAG: hypothetical protein GC172_09755 [Phycisphaera sp.]|nr:hypothetical protein [Phycisphaera sp.]